MLLLILSFSRRMCFLVVAKKTRSNTYMTTYVHLKQETANKQHRAHVTQHSLQTTQSTRDTPKQRAATKARSHQTDDKRLASL